MLKKYLKTLLITSLITLFPVLIIYCLPSVIPDMSPETNTQHAHSSVVLVISLISVFVEWVLAIIITIRNKKNLDKPASYIPTMAWACTTTTCCLSGAICAIATGGLDGALKTIPLLLGIAFIITGNIAPKIPYKAWGGLKSQAAMYNSDVWTKTHRYLGKLSVACGVVIMLCSFFPATDFIWIFIAILALFATLMPVIYANKLKTLEQTKSI